MIFETRFLKMYGTNLLAWLGDCNYIFVGLTPIEGRAVGEG